VWVVLLALPTLGAHCLQGEYERNPDAVPRAMPLATRFVADGVDRELIAPNGTVYQLEARTAVAANAQSADLWMLRNRSAQFEGPAFLGAVPSCLGRPLTRPGTGDAVSACYLAAARLRPDGQISIKMYLGGGWATTLDLALAPAFTDSDGDGANDALEALLGTNPRNADTDGDGDADPEDSNPLVAPAPQPLNPGQLDIWKLTRLAVEDLLSCKKGKPYFVIGPAAGRQSFPSRPCRVLYLDEGTPAAATRALLLPSQGRAATGEAALRETALTGGIPRARITVDAVGAREATVTLQLHGGRVVKTLERVVNKDLPRQSEWRLVSKRVELAGGLAEE